MIEKGIQPPDQYELAIFEQAYPELGRWVRLLYGVFPKINGYSQSIDVASVAANSESVQTFTVAGLVTSDVVIVNKPSNSAGLDLVQSWVSAADTLSLKYRNHTGSPIDPGSETYRIIAIRL
ncbi:MAG: hypothetical protein OES84_00055 [Kiritimatiellaceae bacterium]|nr:hypothetical protein [Kiritimatiellaceae bacterium]